MILWRTGRFPLVLLALSMGLAGVTASAAVNPDLEAAELNAAPPIFPAPTVRAPLAERYAGLSPEQRQQMREQIREQWQNRPPEERQRLREDFRDQREFQNPRREERQRLRDDLREHSGGGGGGVFFRRGGGRF